MLEKKVLSSLKTSVSFKDEKILNLISIQRSKRNMLKYFKQLASRKSSFFDLQMIHFQLTKELIEKWKSRPDDEHIPLTRHMQIFAIKAISKLVFGDFFDSPKKLVNLHNYWEKVCWLFSRISSNFL